MGFASTYLEKRAIFPELIKEAPDRLTGIIVVIPAYNEPGIAGMLDSLYSCSEPECKIEVIIVVNAPEQATHESIENNELTLLNIESWKREHRNCFFRLFAFNAEPVSKKGWGVGQSRKTGMDEALRRFNSIDKPGGIIVCLDADCLVEKNYFISIYDELLMKKDRSACSIFFEHPLSGTDFPENTYKYITLYELHLRYYIQGIAFAGFPYVFHTVGSAIAVKALAYMNAGGMNKRQAGEDFYFIQKLVPSGGYFSLNSTTVYPSPRPSFRVPFGTGASIEKLTAGNKLTLLTYNIEAFKELKYFFGLIEKFYCFNIKEMNQQFQTLPAGIKIFLNKEEWIEKMTEIKLNTSGLSSFKKRFFEWFNMFRIVKYMNSVHAVYLDKQQVEDSASALLENTGIVFKSKNPEELLLFFRKMERDS